MINKNIFRVSIMKKLVPQLYNISEKKLWKKSLKKYGFVVIKNILTEDEKDIIYNQFKIDLNIVSPNFDSYLTYCSFSV